MSPTPDTFGTMTEPYLPAWWPYQEELPAWRPFRGIDQLYYAELTGTELVVRGESPEDLRDQIRLALLRGLL